MKKKRMIVVLIIGVILIVLGFVFYNNSLKHNTDSLKIGDTKISNLSGKPQTKTFIVDETDEYEFFGELDGDGRDDTGVTFDIFENGIKITREYGEYETAMLKAGKKYEVKVWIGGEDSDDYGYEVMNETGTITIKKSNRKKIKLGYNELSCDDIYTYPYFEVDKTGQYKTKEFIKSPPGYDTTSLARSYFVENKNKSDIEFFCNYGSGECKYDDTTGYTINNFESNRKYYISINASLCDEEELRKSTIIVVLLEKV